MDSWRRCRRIIKHSRGSGVPQVRVITNDGGAAPSLQVCLTQNHRGGDTTRQILSRRGGGQESDLICIGIFKGTQACYLKVRVSTALTAKLVRKFTEFHKFPNYLPRLKVKQQLIWVIR
jgi:hypothetical protein